MALWTTLRDFVEKFSDSGDETVDLGEEEVRLAAAALLVHATVVDGEVDKREEEALRDVLERGFNLDQVQVGKLITQATEKEKEAIDLDVFTSVLTRRLDREGRMEIVGMLWEVINADGVLHEFEGKLAWRAAQSLGITPNDWVKLRKKVEARHA
jgi:uncharacterized tellurite resistance protein B-like protein